jgi:hypothetical protein
MLKNNQLPIVIGGSKETTLGASEAFLNNYPNGKLIFLFGLPCIGRLYDNDKLTSTNVSRKVAY